MFDDPDRIASLIYLGLLALVIGGSLFVSQRKNLGKMAQYAAIWVFIFLGAIVTVGLWQDISGDLMQRQSVAQGGEITVPRHPDGHFYLVLDINDVPIRFVVDTGATDMVLSQEDAARVGIDTENLIYLGRANTANGVVGTATVDLATVGLGGVVDTNLRAVVNGGELFESLLGMSYLSRFSRLEIAGNQLTLQR